MHWVESKEELPPFNMTVGYDFCQWKSVNMKLIFTDFSPEKLPELLALKEWDPQEGQGYAMKECNRRGRYTIGGGNQ